MLRSVGGNGFVPLGTENESPIAWPGVGYGSILMPTWKVLQVRRLGKKHEPRSSLGSLGLQLVYFRNGVGHQFIYQLVGPVTNRLALVPGKDGFLMRQVNMLRQKLRGIG